MRRLRDESGFALLAVMGVLVITLALGMSLVKIIDTQTGASKTQRERDAAFNLAESVLSAQVFTLARDWPGSGQAATPYPACTQASTSSRCPDAATLLAQISPDAAAGATWQTNVHENDVPGASAFYSESLLSTRPGYDANRDGRVWARVTATVRGHTRTLVALVGAERQEEAMPQAAVIAGRVTISNEGNKPLVDANGGLFAVRCVPDQADAIPCLGHTFGAGKYRTFNDLLGSLATQVSGAAPVTGYTGGAALSPEARARLKATAIADGTYFASCPSSSQLSGQVIYVASGNCSYTSNEQINSAARPGLLLLESGSVSFGGTTSFNGVVYAANVANSSGWAVQTLGNARITGGVLIDGGATLVAGSSSLNIVFDSNAYRAVASYVSAGLVQNTWRELLAG